MNNRFYIYVYLDPRKQGKFVYGEYEFDYEPFYVGKGQRFRKNYHLTPKSLAIKHPKNSIIKKLLSIDLKPIVLTLINNLTDDEANDFERQIINIIGRKDLKLGPLRNLIDGGGSIPNRKITKKALEILQLAGKKRRIKINKGELLDLYINQDKEAKELAKYFNCSLRVLYRRLKEFGFTKTKPNPHIPEKYCYNLIMLNKEKLYEEYIIKNKSINTILKEFNITINTLSKNLKIYEFRKREKRKKYDVSYEQFYKEYITNNKTINECCDIFGCKVGYIGILVRKYNIRKKPIKITK